MFRCLAGYEVASVRCRFGHYPAVSDADVGAAPLSTGPVDDVTPNDRNIQHR